MIKAKSGDEIISADSSKTPEEIKELAEIEKKLKEYELAKNRIFEQDEKQSTQAGEPISVTQKISKKNINKNSDSYDPAFDRARGKIKIPEMEPVNGGYYNMFPQIGVGIPAYGMINPYPQMIINQFTFQNMPNMMGVYPFPGNYNNTGIQNMPMNGGQPRQNNNQNMQNRKGPQ